jgi:ABC-type transporter Mla MlaB component
MLRIWTETRHANGDTEGLHLRLEGQVRGPWVIELARVVDEAMARGQRLQVDLAGVSFLDADAVSLLRSLQSREVTLVNCRPFTAAQLGG